MKNLPAMQETRIWSLVWENLWRWEWQPTPVILAWRIPWSEEASGLQSIGSQRVDTIERLVRPVVSCSPHCMEPGSPALQADSLPSEPPGKWKWRWKSLSTVRLSVTPWTTVHGILQARILELVAFPFSRGSSQPRDQTQVSHIAGRFFTSWATREAQDYWSG